MAVVIVTVAVDRRYYRKKSRRFLCDRINDLHRALGSMPPPTRTLEAEGKPALIERALALHALFPED